MCASNGILKFSKYFLSSEKRCHRASSRIFSSDFPIRLILIRWYWLWNFVLSAFVPLFHCCPYGNEWAAGNVCFSKSNSAWKAKCMRKYYERIKDGKLFWKKQTRSTIRFYHFQKILQLFVHKNIPKCSQKIQADSYQKFWMNVFIGLFCIAKF